jgi:hypothetical protein
VPIGERVREAHLEHFCPGGAGLPVTSSRPIGLDPGDVTAQVPDSAGAYGPDRHCGRCGQPIGPGQDARRRVSGIWVHENCPP